MITTLDGADMAASAAAVRLWALAHKQVNGPFASTDKRPKLKGKSYARKGNKGKSGV